MKLRQIAWILILIVDMGYVAWGGMAAVMPDGLIGPTPGSPGRSFCARLR